MKNTNFLNKKTMAILLLVVMAVINLLPAINVTQVNAWCTDESCAVQPSGEGTSASPFLINEPEELLWVSQQTNAGTNFSEGKYFRLMDNIDLEAEEFDPIGDFNTGDTTSAFKGHFDGNDYFIKLLNSTYDTGYTGLFGYLDSATVEDLSFNLTAVMVEDTTTDIYAGILAGYSNNSEINNVSTWGNFGVYASSADVYAGGIVGYAVNTDFYEIVAQTNNTVNSYSDTSNIYAGGIAGKTVNSTIEKSYSSSALKVNDKRAEDVLDPMANYSYVGGLVGELNESNVLRSFNTGELNVESEKVMAGGIAGYFTGTTTGKSITHTYNMGDVNVKATDNVSSVLYVGGIVGQITNDYIISYGYNSAEIVVDTEFVDSANKGSLVGFLGFSSTISYFMNNTEVQSLGTEGIGVLNGTANFVEGHSTMELKNISTFTTGDQSWHITEGFSSTTWKISGLNGGYPILLYVGNASINIQTAGQGTTNITGMRYVAKGTYQTVQVTAVDGYQVGVMYYQNEQLTGYNGKSDFTFPILVTDDDHTLLIEFIETPFYSTLLFQISTIFGSLIILVVVLYFVINHNYEKKLRARKKLADRAPKTKIKEVKINNQELNKKPKK